MSDSWEEKKLRTAEAFDVPEPGDRFHEMYSFWLYVVAVNGDTVTTMEANPPCSFPKDGKIKRQTKEEFRQRFAYGPPTPGYWVTLEDRGNNVEGWLKEGGIMDAELELILELNEWGRHDLVLEVMRLQAENAALRKQGRQTPLELEMARIARDSVQEMAARADKLKAENERLTKRAECFNERFQAACNREDNKFLEILHLQAKNAALRVRAVPNYSEQCPTLPGWYFVRHPRPDDNPDIVGEIYRASDGLLYVEICNSSIDADDWALVQDAFMQGYRFAGPIPEPKGGGDE